VKLTDDDLVVADNKGPLDIAGVRGGDRAEITQSTKNILLIASVLSPVSIRRTVMRHDIRTDASRRYENKIVPETAGEAFEKASVLAASIFPKAKIGPVADVFLKKTDRARRCYWRKTIGQGF